MKTFLLTYKIVGKAPIIDSNQRGQVYFGDEDGLTLAAVVRQRLGAEGGAEVPWSRARALCTRGKISIE